jgi:6-phosphogluconolactonase
MQLHILKNPTELSKAAAEWITSLVTKKLATSNRFCFLLSGGNTPKQLYQLLASDEFRNKIDWKKIHIFFGDERVVPFEDDRNNGKMAYDSLLSKVPIPKEQIHYIDTNKEPEQSAEDYERLLHQYFDNEESSFDLSLLGMGDDGHTLSVFPGTLNPLFMVTNGSSLFIFLPNKCTG